MHGGRGIYGKKRTTRQKIIQSLRSLFCERINTKLRAKNIVIENMLHLSQLCLNNLIPSKLILRVNFLDDMMGFDPGI